MALTRRLQLVDINREKKLVDTALKIAFASTDRKHVNQHFGSAKAFVIYAVAGDSMRFDEVIEFGEAADYKHDGNEDKLIEKMSALKYCCAVYAQAIGTSAIRQLMALSVQPIKVDANADIRPLIIQFQQDINDAQILSRGHWLRRALARLDDDISIDDNKRFDDFETEGWDE